jgi:hypothetical protein
LSIIGRPEIDHQRSLSPSPDFTEYSVKDILEERWKPSVRSVSGAVGCKQRGQRRAQRRRERGADLTRDLVRQVGEHAVAVGLPEPARSDLLELTDEVERAFALQAAVLDVPRGLALCEEPDAAKHLPGMRDARHPARLAIRDFRIAPRQR